MFGSWSEAIEAAGFTPRPRGNQPRKQPPAPTDGSQPNASALPIGSADLSRRVAKVVAYPPLVEMDESQRRELQEALLDPDGCEELPGKWQAAGLEAEAAQPKLRLVNDD